jgi:hypothetical protein
LITDVLAAVSRGERNVGGSVRDGDESQYSTMRINELQGGWLIMRKVKRNAHCCSQISTGSSRWKKRVLKNLTRNQKRVRTLHVTCLNLER